MSNPNGHREGRRQKRANGLPKWERLNSKYLIDRMFMPGNSRSLSAYPLRLVYRLIDGPMAEDGGVGEKALLISVPKRCFKHAVDRNKVKRQVREAYRAHRDLLALPDGKSATLAFIWLDSKHHPSDVVCAKVCNLMQRMQEAIHKHIQKEKAAEELEKAEMGKMVEGND